MTVAWSVLHELQMLACNMAPIKATFMHADIKCLDRVAACVYYTKVACYALGSWLQTPYVSFMISLMCLPRVCMTNAACLSRYNYISASSSVITGFVKAIVIIILFGGTALGYCLT